MRLQRLMIRGWQSIIGHLTDGTDHRRARQPPFQPAGHPVGQGRLVGRLPLEIFGEHPDPTAGRHKQFCGNRPLPQFRRHIDGAVAQTDDDNAFSNHINGVERGAILMGVKLDPVELARKGRDIR